MVMVLRLGKSKIIQSLLWNKRRTMELKNEDLKEGMEVAGEYWECRVCLEKFHKGTIKRASNNYLVVVTKNDWFMCRAALKLRTRTIEDVDEGDMLVDSDGKKYKVLGRCGDVVFKSYPYEYGRASSFICSIQKIKDNFKFAGEEKLVHLTIQDISEGKGKSVDPKLLRVKE